MAVGGARVDRVIDGPVGLFFAAAQVGQVSEKSSPLTLSDAVRRQKVPNHELTAFRGRAFHGAAYAHRGWDRLVGGEAVAVVLDIVYDNSSAIEPKGSVAGGRPRKLFWVVKSRQRGVVSDVWQGCRVALAEALRAKNPVNLP